MSTPPSLQPGCTLTRQSGSLLLELSLALAVGGALAGIAYSVTDSALNMKDGQDATLLVASHQAKLLEFAYTHNRLPCPDLTGDGHEGNGGGCPPGAVVGGFPYRTLELDDAGTSANQVLRYGVFRAAPDGDIVAPLAGLGLTPRADFMKAAYRAVAAGVTGQPYVPELQSTGVSTNCSTVGAVPAFVLSVGPASAVGSGICFPIPSGNQGATVSFGRTELAGWLAARMRGSS